MLLKSSLTAINIFFFNSSNVLHFTFKASVYLYWIIVYSARNAPDLYFS